MQPFLQNLLQNFMQTAEGRMGVAQERMQVQEGAAARVRQYDAAALAAQQATVAATQAAARGEAEIATRTIAAKERAAAILRLNADDVESALVQNAAIYDESERQRRAVRSQIDQLNQIQLLDNPLAFFVAQLQLPQLAAKNNALVDRRDSAAADLNMRQELLRQQQSLPTATTVDVAAEVNRNRAAAIYTAAERDLAIANREAAARDATGRMSLLQIKDQQFGIADDLHEKRFQMFMQNENLEDRRLSRAMQAESLRLQRADRQDKIEEQQELDRRLADFSMAIGLEQPLTTVLLRRMPPAVASELKFAAMTGNLGNNPAEVRALINTFGNPNNFVQRNPGMNAALVRIEAGVESFIAPARTELEREQMAATRAGAQRRPITEEIVRERAQSLYMRFVAQSAHDPRSPDTLSSAKFDQVFSPYRIDTQMFLSDQAAVALRDNAFANAIRTVKQTRSRPSTDPLNAQELQRAVHLVAERVARGELSREQAAEAFTAYHTLGVGVNADRFKYMAIGIPMQRNYMFRVARPRGEPIVVDMLNPASTRTMIDELLRPLTRMERLTTALDAAGAAAGANPLLLPALIGREAANIIRPPAPEQQAPTSAPAPAFAPQNPRAVGGFIQPRQ